MPHQRENNFFLGILKWRKKIIRKSVIENDKKPDENRQLKLILICKFAKIDVNCSRKDENKKSACTKRAKNAKLAQ